MRRYVQRFRFLLIAASVLLTASPVFAASTRGHLIHMGKELGRTLGAPFYHLLVKGPRDIGEMYTYEVRERENPEERNKFRYKMFAAWRAPGVETKAAVEGVVKTVEHAGDFLKEFVSIFFSD